MLALAAMLDIVLFRTGEEAALRESQRRRGADPGLIDQVIAADAIWRQSQARTVGARTGVARARKAMRTGATASALETVQALSREAVEAEASELRHRLELQRLMLCVGNLVHEDAPVSDGGTTAAKSSPRAAPSVAYPAPSSTTWERRQDAWLAHALRFVQARGFHLTATPLALDSGRMSKLDRFCRERGDLPPGGTLSALAAASPLGALHACSWIRPEDLPLRYGLLWPAEAGPSGAESGGLGARDEVGAAAAAACEGASTGDDSSAAEAAGAAAIAPAVPELWLSVIAADDGSCWDAYKELCQMATELHAEMLGLHTESTEVRACDLGRAEARAWVLRTALGADSVELARGACEFDFHARRLGVRCGFKKQGEHSKRHVHTLTVRLFRPSVCQQVMAARYSLARAQGEPVS